MIKLITINSELESAKQLEFEAFVPSDRIFLSDIDEKDIYVRWGNSVACMENQASWKSADFKRVINPYKAIRTNCEKPSAIKLFSQVVDTPKMFSGKVPDGIEVVVRDWEHSHGKNFTVSKGPILLNSFQYATQFIKTETEYRVWFCGDKTFAAKRVALTDEDKKAFPCRSNWGYKYCDRVPDNLSELTLKAAAKIGLEIGAADILYSDKKYYFLELNSAPSIDTNYLKKFFRTGIETLVKKKFPDSKV